MFYNFNFEIWFGLWPFGGSIHLLNCNWNLEPVRGKDYVDVDGFDIPINLISILLAAC